MDTNIDAAWAADNNTEICGQNKNTSPKWQWVDKKLETTFNFKTRQKKQKI